ncbi:MAG: YIP1 family protein, partial [Caulobacteraceae bacterium]|nr:YIP1 family protein [Caulobacteraceae bacterium]
TGDARITLTVVDMGAAGGVLGIAGAFNVNSSNESDGRYEKVGKVNGRMTMEEFDRNSGHGEYGVMVADRFMVQAEGDNGATIGDLKAAVTAVNFARLEGLARG